MSFLKSICAPIAANNPGVSHDYVIGVVGCSALRVAKAERILLAYISMESFGYDLDAILGVFHPQEKK